MKCIFFNDLHHGMGVHPGSVGVDINVVEAGQAVMFDIPEGTIPFIKIWKSTVLLSWSENELDKK